MTLSESPIGVLDLFVAAGLCASKGEARRLMQGGGARIDDVSITDDAMMVDINGTLKLSAGKKKHVLVNAA